MAHLLLLLTCPQAPDGITFGQFLELLLMLAASLDRSLREVGWCLCVVGKSDGKQGQRGAVGIQEASAPMSAGQVLGGGVGSTHIISARPPPPL